MDYVGLIFKFKVDRPLTDEERQRQLRRKKRLAVEPSDHLAVVAVNSTYLETLDRYYAEKGWLTLWAIVGLLMTTIMVAVAASGPLMHPGDKGAWLASTAIVVMTLPLFFVGGLLLRKEAFGCIHHPIRLNRKTRTVHAFRHDGTVLSVSWDEVFFCLGRDIRTYGTANWDIRGHVLAENGSTVRETFSFASTSWDEEEVLRHWEFLRRYMEDGPEEAYRQTKYCMPVNGRRETFTEGWWRLMADEWFLPMRWLGYPLIVLAICTRWLAMRWGKVPQWPAEIEVSHIEPSDPYAKDARDNPKDFYVNPAWSATWGVAVLAAFVGLVICGVGFIFSP